jgi:hypothetical protein
VDLDLNFIDKKIGVLHGLAVAEWAQCKRRRVMDREFDVPWDRPVSRLTQKKTRSQPLR